MDILNIVLLVEWGIIGLFVLFNFLIGLKRGTKKSVYYLIVSFILTVILLIGLSFASVRLIAPEAADLVRIAEKYINLEDNIKSIILDPALSPYVYLILDVVLKLILFLIIYPIVKWLLTLIIFRPIWNKFLKPDKSEKPSGVSRLGGGLVGAVRGFIVAFILFIPLIVISSSVSAIETNKPKPETNNQDILRLYENMDDNTDEESLIPEDILEYIYYLQQFNEQGIGKFMNDVPVGKSSIADSIFDAVFVSKVKGIKEKPVKIKLTQELKVIINVFNTANEKGYLKSDFDFNKINYEEDFETIKEMVNLITNSNILDLALPTAMNYLYNSNKLTDILGYDVKLNEYTKEAYKLLSNVNITDELKVLVDIVENILKIGSIEEITALFGDPKSILDLPIAKRQLFANIIGQFGNFDILVAANIGLEYLANDESFLNQITWSENPSEYIHEKLQFIFSDTKYFLKEDNDFKMISNILANLGKEQFAAITLDNFMVDGEFDFKSLLKEEESNLISQILIGLSDVKLLVKAIPIGLDFALRSNGDELVQTIADDLSLIINTIDFGDEIKGINDLYKKIVKIATDILFTEQPLNILLVDKIFEKPETVQAVKSIINDFLIESDLISRVLDAVAEPLIESFVNDDALKQYLILTVEQPNFSFAEEIVNVVKIAESLYKFTNLEDLLENINNKDYLKIAYDFADMSQSDFNEFKLNLTNFQLLKTNPGKLINHFASKSNFALPEMIVTVDHQGLQSDFNRILDLVYATGKNIKEKNISLETINTENIFNIVSLDSVKDLLTFNASKDIHSASYIYLREMLKDGFVVSGFELKLPSNMINNDQSLITELNVLSNSLTSILKDYILLPDSIEITLNKLTGKEELGIDEIPIMALVDQLVSVLFNDKPEDNLSILLQSKILKQFITDLLDSPTLRHTLNDAVRGMEGFETVNINTAPELRLKDPNTGLLLESEIRQIFEIIRVLKISEVEKFDLAYFNTLDTEIDVLLDSNYLRVLISRILSTIQVKNYLANALQVNPALVTFSGIEKDEMDNISKNEIKAVLKAIQTLGITSMDGLDFTALLVGLTTTKVNTILESTFFYHILSLVIQSNLTIPADAIDQTGRYTGYISKTEILKIVEMINILNLESIDISNLEITIKNLEDIIALDSIIVNTLITDQLTELLSLPNESFVDNDPTKNITNLELSNIVRLIKIIEPNDDALITNINFDNLVITTKLLDELLLIDNSPFISTLLTTEIVKVVDLPDESFVDNDPTKNITNLELSNIVRAIKVIQPNEEASIANIDFNTLVITTKLLEDLLAIDNSPFISTLLSTEIVKVVDLPDESFVDNDSTKNITNLELNNIVKVLKVLQPDQNASITTIDFNNLTISTKMLDELLMIENSPFVDKVLSDAITDSLNVPLESHIDNDVTKNLKRSELLNIVEAIKLIEPNDEASITNIDFDNLAITIALLDSLLAIGDSPIIANLMTAPIQAIPTLTVPVESYYLEDVNKYITHAELLNIVSAIKVIQPNNTGLVDQMDIDNTVITTTMLSELLGIEDSPFISRLISSAIIDATDVPTSAFTNANETDILHTELVKLVSVLEILEITDVTLIASKDMNAVSFTHLIAVQNIDSIIITRKISTALIDQSLDPNSALVVSNDVKVDNHVTSEHILALFVAANSLNATPPVNTLADLDTYFVTIKNDPVQVGALYGNQAVQDSLIVRQTVEKMMTDLGIPF